MSRFPLILVICSFFSIPACQEHLVNALIEVIDAIWKLMEYQVFNQMKIGILQVVKRKQGDFVRQEGTI